MKPWHWQLRWQVIGLFVLGLAARAGLVLVTHQYRDTTRFELQRTAYSLATTGVFGNPYAIETGPTAHVSPGYPLILAGVYQLFGAGERGELVKEFTASAVSAAGWALLPVAGSVFGMPPIVGFFAGVLGAALPLKLSVETKGDWEAPYSALATMLTACMTRLLWLKRTFSVREALQTGFAWGTSLWFVSALLPALLVFALAGIFRGAFVSRYGRFLAVQFAVVAVMLAPWVIRNQLALGSPIVTRSNLGLELRLSNNDLAGPLERENYERGVYHVYHPLQNVKQAERVKALGEPEFNRQSTREAFAWATEHPAPFVKLTAERIFYFWLQPIPGQTAKAVWLGLLCVAGFLGLWRLARADFWAALPMALFLLVLPLPNYLVHVGLRHRFPLDWICLLLTVYYFHHAFTPNRLASDAGKVRGLQKR
jgi:hypothetical protein